MSWRKLFQRIRPQAPARHAPARPPVPIARPAAYQPVPASLSDTLDAEVTALWIGFQKHHQPAAWPAFIAHLAAENAQLSQQIKELRIRLAGYYVHRTFVP
ncbi:MAG: hypothetical protein J0I57_04205 [Hyphomicrobium sp.]|nr:hypothetical protein [Hyphomicrobium sp.]